ncbi:MAG: helix-turn-helix domain-containing protein [Candidatus Woesearchaeota archaeon]
MAKKKETFMLVSLEEDKAKKLAQVISNNTCRKILDHLAGRKATESELARDLEVPISTVHYNLKHLLANKLVEAEEFHYSEKGKEVLHYSLSNKYVIIAPKDASEGIKEKLKSIIGAVASVGFVALAVQYLPGLISSLSIGSKALASEAEQASSGTGAEAGVMAMEKSAEAAPAMADAAGAAGESASFASMIPVWAWILAGATACMLLYLLFEYLRKRKSDKTPDKK